mgnify:CR=1 FL=1
MRLIVPPLQQLLCHERQFLPDGTFTSRDYPQVEALKDYNALYDEVMATDATLLAADAAARAAEKNISVSRQSWLPKLEIGYRRNTSLDEKSNGFPYRRKFYRSFSNRKKHQIARAQAISAQYQLDNARLQAEAQVQSQFNEMQQLTTAMQAYDVELMHQTLDMLKEAVYRRTTFHHRLLYGSRQRIS